MKVKVWGGRGSLPSPYPPQVLEDRVRKILTDFADSGTKKGVDKFLDEYPDHLVGGWGGNTSCIEVFSDAQHLIIDGGTGIRPMGLELMSGPCGKGEGELHILFTHFHWDHLIGLPFFVPIFIPGNKINVYAVQPDLPEVFQTIFRKPYFPVPLKGLGAQIHYHRLEPRAAKQFGDIQVTPYQLDHPDPCWGFKFEQDGKVFSHCVDTEATRVTQKELGKDLPLYQGVDAMLFDAQYTLMETIEKINWGHAAASIGLDIAMREGVKKVYFMHHDPNSSDEKIAAAEAEARRYYKGQLKSAKRNGQAVHEVEWAFVYEGHVIQL